MACPINPADCVGGIVSGVTDSALDALVKSIADAVESMLQTVSTFWLSVPSPAVDSPAVAITRLNLEWLVAIMVAVGLMVAMARMAITNRVSEVAGLGRMYLTLTLVTGISTLVVTALLQAGDQMAPWFIQQATGQSFSSTSATLITSAMLTGTGQGAGLILGLLALLASILQIVAMLVRGAFVVLIMGVLPPLAADTTSEAGFFRFKRAVGWLGACILYKPVAAIIYAAGFMEMKGDTPTSAGGASQTTQSLYSVIEGLIIIVLAVVALPALMRFIAPVSQRAGGGGNVAGAVGGIATGAAVVAGVIATGGAAAPAAAAAGGAGTATAGGAVGGAAAGGGAAGGGAGGGSGAGGTGSGASGGGSGGGGSSSGGSSGVAAGVAGAGGASGASSAGAGSADSGSSGSGGAGAADGAGGAGQAAGFTAQGAGLVAQGASGAEQTASDTSGAGAASGADTGGTA